MLYCAKCRSVCEDHMVKCSNCKSQKLRPVKEEDSVRLRRANLYTAQRLGERLEAAGIPYETEAACGDWGPSPYDSEAMPTDRNIYVEYGCLSSAEALSASLEEEEGGEEEQFEELPRKKRILVQIFSAIAFLLLVMLTVYGADALAGWLKSLFGM